jgi:hypothetical protein
MLNVEISLDFSYLHLVLIKFSESTLNDLSSNNLVCFIYMCVIED